MRRRLLKKESFKGLHKGFKKRRLKKLKKEGFRDEGASYPATPQGIQEMINEVDFSRR